MYFPSPHPTPQDIPAKRRSRIVLAIRCYALMAHNCLNREFFQKLSYQPDQTAVLSGPEAFAPDPDHFYSYTEIVDIFTRAWVLCRRWHRTFAGMPGSFWIFDVLPDCAKSIYAEMRADFILIQDFKAGEGCSRFALAFSVHGMYYYSIYSNIGGTFVEVI